MFSTIDIQTKTYLKKVMKSLFVGLFWMFANIVAGIFLECGFIDKKLSTTNYIFYSLSFISLIWLVYFFIKLWRKPVFTQEQ